MENATSQVTPRVHSLVQKSKKKVGKHVHVVRMRPYADSSLSVGPDVQPVFSAANRQGELQIPDITGTGEYPVHEKNILRAS